MGKTICPVLPMVIGLCTQTERTLPSSRNYLAEFIASLCNGSGQVIYEFPENELGEVVNVQFTAKSGSDTVIFSGVYMGINTA